MGVPAPAADEAAIREVDRRVLADWNERDAEALAREAGMCARESAQMVLSARLPRQ